MANIKQNPISYCRLWSTHPRVLVVIILRSLGVLRPQHLGGGVTVQMKGKGRLSVPVAFDAMAIDILDLTFLNPEIFPGAIVRLGASTTQSGPYFTHRWGRTRR